MQLIAVTGGIGSGKSTVAARLGELGAVVVDADAIARDVVAPGSPGLQRIVERFGEALLSEDGSLDRAALASRVFADEEQRLALNAIVHPLVREESARRFREAGARDPDAVVVYDVPLIEARGAAAFDRIVVVDAPAAVRLDRLVTVRGMSADAAAARIASQLSDEARLELADDVIRSDGPLAETLAATDALWRELRSPGRLTR